MLRLGEQTGVKNKGARMGQLVGIPTSKAKTQRERELRVQAVHLAAMLPDDPAEARRVLAHLQRIVNYLEDDLGRSNSPLNG